MMKAPGKKPPKILKTLFVVCVIAALGFVAWHTIVSSLTKRRHIEREVPQLRADVVAELEDLGLARSPVIGEDGAIRFGHPPTMSSDDLMLLLRRIIQQYDLVLSSAVKYEERRELFVELSSREQRMVARFLFAPGVKGEMLAGAIRGRIGLIIDDFGYIRNRLTAGFIAMNEKLTLSVIPGHRYSRVLAEEAARRGHEVIIHMPMEPENYNGVDEEEFILLYGMEETEALGRIRRAFQEIPQAAGMNNHEGSLATLDTLLMDVLAQELLRRNKYFVDSYTTPETRALGIMARRAVPSMGRHVFLDNEDDPRYIRRQLALLASWAEETGAAIGIAHVGSSHLNTLEVLAAEIPKLKDRGFQFVYVSELVR
ncbi:MAG: divergent polysaccharide deacetylase family protein [Fidelibacterota bacterium]|nr:MAG: divergent polysaccharide deacetylase family protein [Candidatus Neomarinimicrobiota bacterium]